MDIATATVMVDSSVDRVIPVSVTSMLGAGMGVWGRHSKEHKEKGKILVLDVG